MNLTLAALALLLGLLAVLAVLRGPTSPTGGQGPAPSGLRLLTSNARITPSPA